MTFINKQPPAVDNTPKNLPFGANLMSGYTAGDIFNFELSGDNVGLESIETFRTYFDEQVKSGEIDPQVVDQQYGVLEKAYDDYRALNFDPLDTSVDFTPKDMAELSAHELENRYVQQDIPWERFTYAHTASEFRMPNGDTFSPIHAQQIAKINSMWEDKNGQLKPYSMYNSSNNPL